MAGNTMKYLIAILLALCAFPCAAQKQGNIWYFGDHAGLDFTSGTPVPIFDGQTYVRDGHCEGTSVICDGNGKLLFYANGEKIWNRSHGQMPNGSGILGSFSSTQGALIVPKPMSNSIYYLFTNDSFYPTGLKNGLRYSIIDLSLDRGMGDVVPDQKNVLLLQTSGEKLAATMHADGRNVWIVTHEYGTDAFYSYLLTIDGIVDTVVTRIGSPHKSNVPGDPNFQKDALGQMKISPDGKKIALCNGNGVLGPALAVMEVFDFDNATGKISKYVNLAPKNGSNIGDPYGVAFSPDSRLLYVGRRITILQFDLSSGDSATIAASLMHVSPGAPEPVGFGMQLGPDGKIYLATTATSIAAITNPNARGVACGYVRNAIDLSGRRSSLTLPSFIDSYEYHSQGSLYRDFVFLPDTITGIGSTIDIPLTLKIDSVPIPQSPTGFTAVLRFKRAALYPVSGTTKATPDGLEATTTFSGMWDGKSSVAGYFRAVASLGDLRGTPLTLVDFKWNDGAPSQIFNGKLSLTGFCEQNGERLINLSNPAAIKVAPNPARGIVRIDYATPEDGRTRLYLMDPLGRIATTMSDTEVTSGDHTATLDVAGLASGSYTLVLETPTARVTAPVQIVE